MTFLAVVTADAESLVGGGCAGVRRCRREIARRFDAAAEMLVSWQLSGPGSVDSTCSGPQPKKMTFARVADFMRPVR